VADAPLLAVMEALADRIQIALASAAAANGGIQIEPTRVLNPTPPCIDIYPADPFLTRTAYGSVSWEAVFIVRARVLTADDQSGQELLLDLMDPRFGSSLIAAIEGDRTLAGTVDDLAVDELTPTGFRFYQDVDAATPHLGCEWRVKVEL